MKKKAIQTGYGCIYDKGEHMIAAQWAMDSNVRSILPLHGANYHEAPPKVPLSSLNICFIHSAALT